MTAEKQFPRMTKDEALDLSTKLTQLDETLSSPQRSFLHFAINRLSQKNQSEVQGFDWTATYDTGYYDMSTGLEIYEVDWYSNAGYYEGTTYYED